MPSDLRHPGAFGFQSVPVSSAKYANETQRGQLMSIFRRDGCHTCGERNEEFVWRVVEGRKATLEAREGETRLDRNRVP
jgi:hypothetical protein